MAVLLEHLQRTVRPHVHSALRVRIQGHFPQDAPHAQLELILSWEQIAAFYVHKTHTH